MRRRSIKKQLWLNQDEERILKEKAKLAGLTESELLRSFIKGYNIKAQPTEEIKQFSREINGIANNVNQIAKVANTYQYIKLEDLKYLTSKLGDFILRFEKKNYSRER